MINSKDEPLPDAKLVLGEETAEDRKGNRKWRARIRDSLSNVIKIFEMSQSIHLVEIMTECFDYRGKLAKQKNYVNRQIYNEMLDFFNYNIKNDPRKPLYGT